MCHCPSNCCVAIENREQRDDCKGNPHNPEAALLDIQANLARYREEGAAVTSPCFQNGSPATGNGFVAERVSPHCEGDKMLH